MQVTLMTIVWFIIIFGIVVLSHEFGHFIIAKANGIRVVEFSVGMGPKIFSVKRKDTVYALRLFPIGGACMFEGEDGRESDAEGKSEAESDAGSFNKAGVWSRIATVVAGPVFNFILAFVVAVILVSMASPAPSTISGVVENSPAAQAGGEQTARLSGRSSRKERVSMVPAAKASSRRRRLSRLGSSTPMAEPTSGPRTATTGTQIVSRMASPPFLAYILGGGQNNVAFGGRICYNNSSSLQGGPGRPAGRRRRRRRPGRPQAARPARPGGPGGYPAGRIGPRQAV